MTKKSKNRNVAPAPTVRCAIYTRKSTEEGLDQEFNTLDAQRVVPIGDDHFTGREDPIVYEELHGLAGGTLEGDDTARRELGDIAERHLDLAEAHDDRDFHVEDALDVL